MAANAVLVLVRGDEEVTVGRVRSAIATAELIDALARLQLAAKRVGASIVLREVSDELAGLLSFLGLEKLFGEPRGQTERCEQIRVEEVVDLDDPVA